MFFSFFIALAAQAVGLAELPPDCLRGVGQRLVPEDLQALKCTEKAIQKSLIGTSCGEYSRVERSFQALQSQRTWGEGAVVSFSSMQELRDFLCDPRARGLRQLSMNFRCNLSFEGFLHLNKLVDLHSLTLMKQCCDKKEDDVLSQALVRLQGVCLIKLTINRDMVTDGGLGGLWGLSTLTTLNLSDNTVGNNGFNIIVDIFYDKELKKLYLCSCGVTCVSQIVRLKKLTHVDLTNNAIQNQGVAYVTDLPELVQLKLCRCGITALTAFKSMSFLKELCLSSNAIGDRGARRLREIFSNSQLTRLFLAQCDIRHGFRDIAQLFMLSYIDLSANAIGDEGAICLVDNLPLSTIIHLCNCRVQNIDNIYKERLINNGYVTLLPPENRMNFYELCRFAASSWRDSWGAFVSALGCARPELTD